MSIVAPISAIVATRNRGSAFTRMLQSLAHQSTQPIEMIVIDGSTGDDTKFICSRSFPKLQTRIVYHRANKIGAAIQRNQAIDFVSQSAVLFMDDDIWFEVDCIRRLWAALESEDRIGGVSAMITNQQYSPPGLLSRILFRILHGQNEVSYAGKCIGPALNLLPEDDPSFPEVVPVEWLNIGCTLYRLAALPRPVFSDHFTGYSMMEDLSLSLRVNKQWKLANARTARIYHDSQPGDHKGNSFELSKMELVNRHYVMTEILERTGISDYLKLIFLEVFSVASQVRSGGWRGVLPIVRGKIAGYREISK